MPHIFIHKHCLYFSDTMSSLPTSPSTSGSNRGTTSATEHESKSTQGRKHLQNIHGNDESEEEEEEIDKDLQCPICLQPKLHPAKLPCSHIFCYLCVKGVAIQSKKCPMCRAVIPPGYIENPTLLEHIPSRYSPSEPLADTPAVAEHDSVSDDEDSIRFGWFYEGRNGWWQYDERTSHDIEEVHKKGEKARMDLLIAGFLYTIDFESMLQCRRNDPLRRRRIKRDRLESVSRKGIAGIRAFQQQLQEQQNPTAVNVQSVAGPPTAAVGVAPGVASSQSLPTSTAAAGSRPVVGVQLLRTSNQAASATGNSNASSGIHQIGGGASSNRRISGGNQVSPNLLPGSRNSSQGIISSSQRQNSVSNVSSQMLNLNLHDDGGNRDDEDEDS